MPSPGISRNAISFISPGLEMSWMESPAAEAFALGDAVGEAVLEIAALVAVGLHRDDIGAVGDQQQIVRRLQVMGAGILPGP